MLAEALGKTAVVVLMVALEASTEKAEQEPADIAVALADTEAVHIPEADRQAVRTPVEGIAHSLVADKQVVHTLEEPPVPLP